MHFDISYKRFGSYSILIDWPEIINERTLNDVLNFKLKIESHNVNGIIQITNTYNSLLLNYDDEFNFEEQLIFLKEIYKSKINRNTNTSKLWKVPVCYDASYGIDLNIISLEKNISPNEIIKRHSQTIYTVYFIGFLPGFLYLGGLDSSISFPRKETPRLKIEKGAVGIGGIQTGVYPNESPGGWNIIGNSPINFFDVHKSPPCFAKAGDKIQFYPITLKAHRDIKALVDEGLYLIESNKHD